MMVLHSGTIDINGGGVATGIYYTMAGLLRHGVKAELFMHDIGGEGRLVGKSVPIHFTAQPIIPKIAYSPSYKRDLLKLGIYDIYHAQGVWQHSTYAFANVARSFRRPYIITPHGMLYPEDISKSNSLLKRLSLKYRLLKELNGAHCIQVTCNQELEICRALGVTSPIAIIPNPVEIREYPEQKEDSIFRVGYLGRISPRKNIESLIYAFDALRDRLQNAELLIIGGGEREYEEFLRSEIKRLKLHNIHFTGFLTGDDKSKAIASLSILVMPSEFENHGIVILEGLVHRIPAIATKGSPWGGLNRYRCGWWVDYSQEAINSAIEKALFTPSYELRQMGIRGRRLVEDNYSVESIGLKMKRLYEWVLTGDNKPEFVYE